MSEYENFYDPKAVEAAKILVDNHEFNVLLDYIEAEAVQALLGGTPDQAADNLRNHNAVRSLRHITRTLSDVKP